MTRSVRSFSSLFWYSNSIRREKETERGKLLFQNEKSTEVNKKKSIVEASTTIIVNYCQYFLAGSRIIEVGALNNVRGSDLRIGYAGLRSAPEASYGFFWTFVDKNLASFASGTDSIEKTYQEDWLRLIAFS